MYSHILVCTFFAESFFLSLSYQRAYYLFSSLLKPKRRLTGSTAYCSSYNMLSLPPFVLGRMHAWGCLSLYLHFRHSFSLFSFSLSSYRCYCCCCCCCFIPTSSSFSAALLIQPGRNANLARQVGNHQSHT